MKRRKGDIRGRTFAVDIEDSIGVSLPAVIFCQGIVDALLPDLDRVGQIRSGEGFVTDFLWQGIPVSPSYGEGRNKQTLTAQTVVL